jgi:hypothetical protein
MIVFFGLGDADFDAFLGDFALTDALFLGFFEPFP